MSITPERFMHKPVDAIRVTSENIEQVAAWCRGETKIYRGIDGNSIEVEEFGIRCIDMMVSHPTGRRTAKAFPGDWIVAVKDSFKVYNNRAFENTFKSAPSPEAVQVYVRVVMMNTVSTMMTERLTDDEKVSKLTSIVEKATGRILDLL